MRGVGYAIWEITFLLVIALAIGVAVGWILRRVLYDTSISALEADAAAAQHRVVQLEARLATEADSASDDGMRAAAQIEELKDRLAALEDARDSEVARLGAEIEARSLRIADLEARLADQVSQATAPASVAPSAEPEPSSVAAARAAVAEIAARTAGGEPVAQDDLRKVHGIGPKIAALLEGMGITSFRQIARFESGDIAHVTTALEAFPGRIERDDWMSSAADEHEKKYGERP